MTDDLKRCARCAKEKPRSEFGRRAQTRDGLYPYCRPCNSEKKRAWRLANPERSRESTRRTNAKRRHKIRAWEREHTTPCIDCGRLVSDGYRKSARGPSERCATCSKAERHRKAFERTKRWLDLRREGLLNYEIAKREGTTADVVANTLQRRRVARFPELEWVPCIYYTTHGRAA